MNTTFILKAFAAVLLVYIVYEVGRTWPLYYPDPSFEYRAEHLNFNLYSDRPVGGDLLGLMDEVATRMEPVDHYDREALHNIYLVHDPLLFGDFARKLKMSTTIQALTIHPLGYVMINLSAVGRTGEIYDRDYPHTLYRGDTAHTISHELMHVLTTQQLGFFPSWYLPDWKREGYAEYGASLYHRRKDAAYSLPLRAKQYMEGYYHDLSEQQQFYVRSGLIVEYLLDVERMDFNTLMSTEIEPDSVLRQLEQHSRYQTN